jgi:hypothetical protein
MKEKRLVAVGAPAVHTGRAGTHTERHPPRPARSPPPRVSTDTFLPTIPQPTVAPVAIVTSLYPFLTLLLYSPTLFSRVLVLRPQQSTSCRRRACLDAGGVFPKAVRLPGSVRVGWSRRQSLLRAPAAPLGQTEERLTDPPRREPMLEQGRPATNPPPKHVCSALALPPRRPGGSPFGGLPDSAPARIRRPLPGFGTCTPANHPRRETPSAVILASRRRSGAAGLRYVTALCPTTTHLGASPSSSAAPHAHGRVTARQCFRLTLPRSVADRRASAPPRTHSPPTGSSPRYAGSARVYHGIVGVGWVSDTGDWYVRPATTYSFQFSRPPSAVWCAACMCTPPPTTARPPVPPCQ